MSRHVGLALDRFDHTPIGVDHKRPSLRRKRPEALDAEGLGYLPVGIGQERKPQVVLVIELLLPIHRISADTNSLGTEFGELLGQFAEMPAFDRSTRRERLWVEEDDQRA